MSEETTKKSYDDYVTDRTFMESYRAYQERYAQNIRESDRILIETIQNHIAQAGLSGKAFNLLDIGCSTGNLLVHIKNRIPGANLVGGDMAANVIEACQKDERLKGIQFEIMDATTMGRNHAGRFDVIVANATLFFLDNEEYREAVKNVAQCLKPGGLFLVFEWMHPFNQDIVINETSVSHPKGLKVHSRPYRYINECLKQAGFGRHEFKPFEIPIDLEMGATYGNNADGSEDLNSYTVQTRDGRRMIFRGSFYQPWCYLIATK